MGKYRKNELSPNTMEEYSYPLVRSRILQVFLEANNKKLSPKFLGENLRKWNNNKFLWNNIIRNRIRNIQHLNTK